VQAGLGFRQAGEWVPTLRQTDWAPKGEQLAVLYQFISMKTGAGIKSTLDFVGRQQHPKWHK
jgi:hypothetical protein